MRAMRCNTLSMIIIHPCSESWVAGIFVLSTIGPIHLAYICDQEGASSEVAIFHLFHTSLYPEPY
jgi:hypothetical protein